MSPWGSPICSQAPSLSTSLPAAQAASSISGRAWRRATSSSAARSQGMPIWCTHRMALVRGVIAPSTRAGSMLNVAGWMSTKTGVAPQ